MEHVRHTKGSHPHEKGLEMIKRMITHSSKPGDTVLDCFAGSGTTGVACQQLGRKCILIEMDKKFIPMIQRRLEGKSAH